MGSTEFYREKLVPEYITNLEKYEKKVDPKHEKERQKRINKAKVFASEVVKKYGRAVKTIIIWGSVLRSEETFSEKSDIDTLIILDDTSIRVGPELRHVIDMDVRKIANKVYKNISVQPCWTLTEFFDQVREQTPLVYSMLREGWAVYDTGFFIPIKKLYALGKMPATSQSALRKLDPAERRMFRAKNAKAMIVFDDIFYAMLESVQGIVAYMGVEPASVRLTPGLMKNLLISKKIIEPKWAKELDDVIKFHKAVEHGTIKDITGVELDNWIKRGDKFVKRMKKAYKDLEKK
ncbi:MAG: hypothetical protein KJ906_00680 [Nanoarchaeota archaeon]|nr:hypothetical protein [Nanoarchaeota archaeon]